MSLPEITRWVIGFIDCKSNPILVKETRQSLHGYMFMILFMILLVVNIIVCLIGTVGNMPIDADDSFGEEMYLALWTVFNILAIIILVSKQEDGRNETNTWPRI